MKKHSFYICDTYTHSCTHKQKSSMSGYYNYNYYYYWVKIGRQVRKPTEYGKYMYFEKLSLLLFLSFCNKQNV